MSTFIKAYEEGIKSAEKIIAQQKEIKEVFTELEHDALIASENKITVCLIGGKKLIARAGDIFCPPQEISLADLEPGNDGGYPCKLIYENVIAEASDREALELALCDLLSLSSTGKKFNALLN